MTRSLVFLALLLTFTCHLCGQNTLYDVTYNQNGSRLVVTAMSSTVPASGYLAVRVEARNGEKVPITWRFDFKSKDQPWDTGSNELSSDFSLSCATGEAKTVEFLVPLVTYFKSGSEATLELQITASPPLTRGQAEMGDSKETSWPEVLMSDTLATPNLGPLQNPSRKGTSGRRVRRGDNFGGSFIPRNLSSDWRAYSGTDVIMMTATDWAEVPPGAQNAVLQWNRLGGRLILYTGSATTDLNSLGISSEAETASNGQRSWGSVELIPLQGLILDVSNTIALVGSGSKPEPKAQSLRTGYSKFWPLQDKFGSRQFNALFFILILIAFAVVVGPVNVFVFAKSSQRHRLFITTPIISLAASLLLVIVIFVQDGFGGKGHRIALIESRPDDNKLYIQQEQIARTGVLFGTTFTVPDHSVLSPIALKESRLARVTVKNEGGDSRYRVLRDEKNKLKYTGDWFQSRSEYGHHLTSIQNSRGRLELLSTSGNPTVTSTFDFPLGKIYYLDSSKKYWTNGAPLTSGRKAELKSVPEAEYLKWLRSLKMELTKETANRLQRATSGRNQFVATTTEGPFIETLSSLKWTDSLAVITGPVVTP